MASVLAVAGCEDHASYVERGIHRGGIDITSAGTPWETWYAVRPIGDEPWYGYGGGWGSVGVPGPESGHRTGPAGPQPDREPADAWTQHHCSEPDQLPAAMRGEWQSPKPADQPSSDKTYYVHLTLTGGAVDTDVGKVDYPGLGCGGSLTRNGDVLDMAYTTEDGEQAMTARPARQPG